MKVVPHDHALLATVADDKAVEVADTAARAAERLSDAQAVAADKILEVAGAEEISSRFKRTTGSVNRRILAITKTKHGRRHIFNDKGSAQIQEAARFHQDLNLEPFPRTCRHKKGSVVAWIRRCLKIKDESKTSDSAAVTAVIIGAANRGRTDMLQWLADGYLWEPSVSKIAVGAADEGGSLLEVLMSFTLPLQWHPSTLKSDRVQSRAVEELTSVNSEKAHCPFGTKRLSQKACLLANILLVDRPCAAQIMSEIGEEMTVMNSSERVLAEGSGAKFPDRLKPLTVKRLVKHKNAGTLMYDRSTKTLKIPGYKTPFKTSAEGPVNLPPEDREDALIPVETEYACFVYRTPEMRYGAFLCLDAHSNPVALNQVSRLGEQGFWFGEYVALDAAASEEVGKLSHLHKIPETSTKRKAGCTHYAWIQETNCIPGVEGNKYGGMAFLFEDPALNRYFPRVAAGGVVLMGELYWEVNAAVLPMLPYGEDLLFQVVSPSYFDKRQVPANVYRLQVPNPCHPVLLHALAFTPREDVLKTVPAKALATAAFGKVFNQYVIDFLLETLAGVCLLKITRYVREERWTTDSGKMLMEMHAEEYVVVISLVLITVKSVIDELCVLRGYMKAGWIKSDYVASKSVMTWLSLVATIGVLAILQQKDTSDQGTVRTLLGFAGFVKWIETLYFLRGFSTQLIGMRILPILFAMWQSASFGVVMFFVATACAQLHYALGDKIFSKTAFGIFRLGFLGDFDTQDDIEGPELQSWYLFQYAAFILISGLMLIALLNIFIGIMGVAYDENLGRAAELFIRARARIGLDYSLRWQFFYGRLRACTVEEDEYVWYCCEADEEEKEAK